MIKPMAQAFRRIRIKTRPLDMGELANERENRKIRKTDPRAA